MTNFLSRNLTNEAFLEQNKKIHDFLPPLHGKKDQSEQNYSGVTRGIIADFGKLSHKSLKKFDQK